MRIAGAPISWGVCEVPGWGYQLPPARVAAEMRELGLRATELGPDGFLTAEVLEEHGLRGIGAFVPVVLHDPSFDPIPSLLAQPGVEVLVLAAATGMDGYDARPDLDARGWETLLRNLDRAMDLDRMVTLHPHVGTMVENRAEVTRVLDGSGVALCLDTGHLLIGGTDPLDVDPGRVAHVHLKDVSLPLAERVRAGELTYTEAVAQGIYQPLGQGDVDVAGIVSRLDKDGYTGWYVMEQDVVLSDAEDDPMENVRHSLAYLETLA
ncbi:sugar phosphate isomerase/epimerase family protein [Nonomuraea sp. NPDC050556]|uniref:sugar phosphate isomerase/epimerase family protein n=1 Tax=Nonomuraea sp. NPDC050556 TaxID=3364369 RepID=UPI0037990627